MAGVLPDTSLIGALADLPGGGITTPTTATGGVVPKVGAGVTPKAFDPTAYQSINAGIPAAQNLNVNDHYGTNYNALANQLAANKSPEPYGYLVNKFGTPQISNQYAHYTPAFQDRRKLFMNNFDRLSNSLGGINKWTNPGMQIPQGGKIGPQGLSAIAADPNAAAKLAAIAGGKGGPTAPATGGKINANQATGGVPSVGKGQVAAPPIPGPMRSTGMPVRPQMPML